MSTKILADAVKRDQSLRKLNAWRMGGVAAHYFRPLDLAHLVDFLQQSTAQMPITWLGLGSNLLVRDGGVPGLVIHTLGSLDEMVDLGAGRVWAQAGVSCAQLARFSVRSGCQGGEFLAGIPGTVGGALAMNAGAFGGETWDHVVEVKLLTSMGILYDAVPGDFDIGYRHVVGQGEDCFVGAVFQFEAGDNPDGLKRIKQLLKHRAKTQPTGEWSCGSVFRNPPDNYAARLIESCGLKGYRIGEAQISTKHANFMINLGDARSADMEALIALAQETVHRETGVQLVPEVRVIGEKDV